VIRYAQYQSLAGAVVRVAFSADKVKAELRNHHRHHQAQTLAILGCISTWNVADARPNKRTFKQLPVDVAEGLATAMVDALT
jgi:hypothetical protein